MQKAIRQPLKILNMTLNYNLIPIIHFGYTLTSCPPIMKLIGFPVLKGWQLK